MRNLINQYRIAILAIVSTIPGIILYLMLVFRYLIWLVILPVVFILMLFGIACFYRHIKTQISNDDERAYIIVLGIVIPICMGVFAVIFLM